MSLSWTGSAFSLNDEDLLVELCFDVLQITNQEVEFDFSSVGSTPISILQNGTTKLNHCLEMKKVQTPCSDPYFGHQLMEQFENIETCINDADNPEFHYPIWNYDVVHYPIDLKIFDQTDNEILFDSISFDPSYLFSYVLKSGRYRIELVNAAGCKFEHHFEYKPNVETIAVSSYVTQSTCPGLDNGSIGIQVDNGLFEYDKVWSTGDTTEGTFGKQSFIEDLSPGLYTLTVPALSCFEPRTYEVEDNTPFTARLNAHFPSCGGADGSIWIDTDPQDNYNYQWEGRSETTSIIDNLESGIYRVTVTGPSGCERRKEITLGNTNDINLEANIDGGCQATTSWNVTINNNDPNTTPLDYTWSTDLIETAQESRMESLGPGNYWVAASNACDVDTVFFELTAGTTANAITLDERDIEQPSCSTANDGLISLRASGGAGEPYTYIWEDGTDTVRYDRLTSGTYRVTISDAVGCSLIDSFTLTSSLILEAEIDEVSSILEVCPGELGFINILTNTNAPVFYHDQSGVNLGDTPALPVGEHVIDVFTDGGCMTQVTVEVTEQTLHMPLVTPIPQTLCEGLTYPLALQIIDNVADLQGTINGDPWNLTDTIDLSPGQYDLNISNIEGCFWDTTIVIMSGEFEPLFEASIPEQICTGEMFSLSLNPSQNLGDNVMATVDGLTWEIDQSVELNTGEHEIEIIVDGACTWDTTFNISQSDLIIEVVDEIEVDSSAAAIIQVLIEGSVAPTIDWTTVSPFTCLNDLCDEISYEAVQDQLIFVTVSDEAGCTIMDSVFITVLPIEMDTEMDTTITTPTGPIQDELFYVPNIVNLESQINNNICIDLTESVASINQFALYNRWGNLVAGPNTQAGTTCLLDDSLIADMAIGVYVYFIEVTLVDGRVVKRAGDVTVVR